MLCLDLGCGNRPLNYSDRRMIWADRYVANHRDRANRAPLLFLDRTRFAQCDAATLPFRDGVFDRIVCRHMLEHVESPSAVCAELTRCGRAGMIETPSPAEELANVARNRADFSSHRWVIAATAAGLRCWRKPEGPDGLLNWPPECDPETAVNDRNQLHWQGTISGEGVA